MGLLDRWTKKTTAKQLSQKEEPKVVEAKSAVSATSAVSSPKSTVTSSQSYRVIVRPLVTEKAAHSESIGKYTFVVGRGASKTQVKQAVRELYGVLPVSVNMVNAQGKRVRFGRSQGRRSDFKKAIVTLPKGKTIAVHEGV